MKKIEFIDSGEGITVKPNEALCKVCRGKLSDNSKLPMCDACIEKAVEIYNGK